MLKKKSNVTARFIVTTAVIYSVIILIILSSYLYILGINSKIIHKAILERDDSCLINRIGILIDNMKNSDIKNTKSLAGILKQKLGDNNDILYVLIYAGTRDENYFNIIRKVPLNNRLKLDIKSDQRVKETKTVNFLKIAVYEPVIDPQIYSSGNLFYKNIYYPFKIKRGNYILEFYISSSEIITALDEYSAEIGRIKQILLIIAGIAVIVVIITMLLFSYNFRLLIRGIAGIIKKSGTDGDDYDFSDIRDDDIKELTSSFRTIIADHKNNNKKQTKDIFKTGVDLFKQEQYDEAIAVFKTLAILKPDSFASFFNMGIAYAKKKDYADSILMLEKALSINPDHQVAGEYLEKVKRLSNDG